MANDACSIEAHRNKVKTTYTDELAKKYADSVGVAPRIAPGLNEIIPETGEWVRQANYFRTPFGDKEGLTKADKDRFIIYWSWGCNWSNRPVIVRDILGLHDVIKDLPVTHTGETNKYGWGFGDQNDHKDPTTGAYFLIQFYKNADPNFKGRPTTPTIVDYKDLKTVSNDYHRITNYFEVFFRKFQPIDAPDLYPVKYRKEIDELNDWLYPHINDAHYRMCFARKPKPYLEAYEDFHASLEKLDKRLETNRFLFGDYITDSDIRLFVSIIRWEIWYIGDTGPQKKRITEYKNLWAYTLELYNIPEFKRYTKLPKSGERSTTNPYYVYISPFFDYDKVWASDGSRKKLSFDPENIYLRHPKGETEEDYKSDIKPSRWDSDDFSVRQNKHFEITPDASINPLKGLLKNEK